MNFELIVASVVLVGILVGLIRNMAPPDVLFLGATTALALFGVITPKEAFAGFSNSGMLTVAMLFVVAAGLRDTGVLEYLGRVVLGSAKTAEQVMLRLSGTIVPMSAFLNNTPIVAMFMPIVLEWSRRNRVSPSKLLIPLSYLTILGGTCTLIGTSTNLVVSGLMQESGMDPLGLFDLSVIGVPYAVVGVLYLLFVGKHLLPDRKDLLEQFGESRREYVVEMRVENSYRFIGKTVEEAGLRHLPGLFLIEIERNDTLIAPVGPDDTICAGDQLVFTGVVSSIVELEKTPGLVPAADPEYLNSPAAQQNRQLCEAVISDSSPLKGQTIREANFRALYGAAVIAVHRNGERVPGKIGDIRLRPGDTLLMQVREHFLRAHRNDPGFYLITNVDNWRPLRRDRAWIAGVLMVLLIGLMSSGVVDTLLAATLVAGLMVVSRCVTTNEARRSVDWSVLITIASSFGVGTAMQNSGLATLVAEFVVSSIGIWGPLAALVAMYLVVSVITEIITNNAVAVLMFPISLEMAKLYDVSAMPFLIALTLGASASFMTPIGYQTNMMVFGPGGYRYGDYFKVGAPLHLLLVPIAGLLIPIFWPF